LQLRHIRALANGYVAPPDACRTWQTAYAQLEAFEADLHRHVHLENEVLFPLARRLVD
jgi:regulator of cell morphogenesis and NO signaling